MNNNNLKIKETFVSALQNHQKNNFKVAESLYKEILKTKPNHFESVFYYDKWWPGTESNRRHKPFQGSALPTELPGLIKT